MLSSFYKANLLPFSSLFFSGYSKTAMGMTGGPDAKQNVTKAVCGG